ncbi:MAG: TonB-dependent receptor [Bacteroidota bacterium]
MFSLGFKGNIKLSDRSKLSFKSHFNALSKTDYTNVFGPNNFDLITSSFVSDSLFENNINTHRLVANLQYDLTFSDRHALFARVSTNKEKEFNRQGGGYWTDNNIIDFEIQDNVQLGSINDLSIGANYRLVNYDIFEINDPTTINFTTLKDSESLTGAFVQNRVRLLGDQLNLIVGVKAENYSLINDTYYISPMAKVSYTPMENLTVWGGYSQSFTTPGLLNTNSEWFFFQQPERERWVEVVTLSVLDQAFRGAVEMGADDATALALAQGFVASPEGQATIQAGTDQQLAAAPNIAIRNSPNSEPTRFTNWELGLRYNMMGQIYFESNFFYSQIDDMVAIFVDPRVFTVQPSASQPGREALFLGYGNYYKGTSIGAESIIKYKPNSALEVEFSHTYLESDWSLQENEDFDIALISEEEQDRNPGTPFIPLHVFRVNFNYDIPDLFRVNVGVTRTSKFNTADDYSYEAERYGNPIDFPEPVSFATIAASDERTLVNLRIEKSFMSNRLDAYLFGNDVFNKGIVAGTFGSTSVSASRIGAMFGAGVNLKIN